MVHHRCRTIKKRMAFIRYDRANQTDQLMVANADGSGEQIISTRKWPQQIGLGLPDETANGPHGDKSLLLPAITSDPGSSNDVAVNYSLSIFEKDLASGAEQTIPLASAKI